MKKTERPADVLLAELALLVRKGRARLATADDAERAKIAGLALASMIASAAAKHGPSPAPSGTRRSSARSRSPSEAGRPSRARHGAELDAALAPPEPARRTATNRPAIARRDRSGD